MLFFFFNDTATTEIYTLSLHDALPIFANSKILRLWNVPRETTRSKDLSPNRSEEHTSELQSQSNLVCRLLLEKIKTRVSPPAPPRPPKHHPHLHCAPRQARAGHASVIR